MSRALQNIAYSGLNAAKKSLETTAHNIANANTEGYSRQQVVKQSNFPVGQSPIIRGTGVKVKEIKRIHDELVEKELSETISGTEYHKERTLLLEQIETMFNEVNDDGLNKSLNNFFNSFRELANQPENETIRSIVREKAKALTQDFKRINKNLDDMEDHLGLKLYKNIESINVISYEIKELNKQITRVEIGQGETGDLRDKRDQLVKDLSAYMDISVYSDNEGRYVVNAEGVGSLVAGGTYNKLKSSRVPADRSTNEKAGSTEIYWDARDTQLPISQNFRKGQLGAIFEVRNAQIGKLRGKMDSIAYNLANLVNAIHSRGIPSKPMQVDSQGNPISSPKGPPYSQVDFFKNPGVEKGASKRIEISDAVASDLGNIATAIAANRPGDNRVAIAISKIQHEKILHEGTTTLEEEYLKSIGDIGLETKKSKFDFNQSEGLLAQVKAIRERVSGVSIDEEAADMVKFQHAYEAAAKVMATSGKMFDTVIGILK